MSNKPESIPRPLVRTNQWVIVLSVIATWITGVYWILVIPLVAGALGVLFDFNPIMRLAKLFLRKPASAYIPEEKAGQRFNQILAASFLLIALVAYSFQWTTLAYTFTALVAVAALVAIMGFCVGCFVRYQWIQYRNKTAR